MKRAGKGSQKGLQRERGESRALIGWHGNTDFFVLLQREEERNSGYHWHDDSLETHAHTLKTNAQLSRINIQGRNHHPPWRDWTAGAILSLSYHWVLLHIRGILFYCFPSLFPLPSFLHIVAMLDLRQPAKSGWHYLGQHTAFLA